MFIEQKRKGIEMNPPRQRELLELFSLGRIGRFFGTTLSFDEDGHARVDLPYNPNLDQPCGIHGGVVGTLLDTAGWFAAAAQSKTILLTTSELSVHFLNPALECDLHAEGWVVKAGKRIFISEMRVAKPNGDVVAIGTGTFVVL
jgi:acyl-CoA thioesterase